MFSFVQILDFTVFGLEGIFTGSVSIPMMKKYGFPNYFAGAVKAAASKGGHHFLPFVVLVGLLVRGNSPIFAALWSMPVILIVSWFRRETRIGFKAVLRGLNAAVIGFIAIVVAWLIVERKLLKSGKVDHAKPPPVEDLAAPVAGEEESGVGV